MGTKPSLLMTIDINSKMQHIFIEKFMTKATWGRFGIS
jgi:hypothetical protein